MPSSQQRAVQNYRARLSEKGLMRFEVLGRSTDRELIRSVAKQLAQNNARAQNVRAVLAQSVAEETSIAGHILAVLRTSPLVGAELDLGRAHETGRSVTL